MKSEYVYFCTSSTYAHNMHNLTITFPFSTSLFQTLPSTNLFQTSFSTSLLNPFLNPFQTTSIQMYFFIRNQFLKLEHSQTSTHNCVSTSIRRIIMDFSLAIQYHKTIYNPTISQQLSPTSCQTSKPGNCSLLLSEETTNWSARRNLINGSGAIKIEQASPCSPPFNEKLALRHASPLLSSTLNVSNCCSFVDKSNPVGDLIGHRESAARRSPFTTSSNDRVDDKRRFSIIPSFSATPLSTSTTLLVLRLCPSVSSLDPPFSLLFFFPDVLVR